MELGDSKFIAEVWLTLTLTLTLTLFFMVALIFSPCVLICILQVFCNAMVEISPSKPPRQSEIYWSFFLFNSVSISPPLSTYKSVLWPRHPPNTPSLSSILAPGGMFSLVNMFQSSQSFSLLTAT